MAPRSRSTTARTSRTNIRVSAPPLNSRSGASASDMRFYARRRRQEERTVSQQRHAKSILRCPLRLQRECLYQALEECRRVLPILELENHVTWQHKLSLDARILWGAHRYRPEILVQRQPRRPFSRSRKPRDAVIGELRHRLDLPEQQAPGKH